MKFKISVVFVAASIFVGCAGAHQDAAGANTASQSPCPLDGHSYDVTLESADAPPQKDTLRFAGGKFESTACTALGFPEWADYAANASGSAIEFHVSTKHPSGTTLDWKGHVDGDRVEGIANRSMNGKTDVLQFKGSLKQ